MTIQTINIGAVANDRTGDPLRTAFTKVNANFTYLNNQDSGLSLVARTGQYSDLIGRPMEFDGTYGSLHGKPTLFSGSYTDLSNRPVLFSGSYNDLSNKPTLFSGSYDDLTNKPVIPASVEISTLKTIVAASTDFADFQARIAVL